MELCGTLLSSHIFCGTVRPLSTVVAGTQHTIVIWCSLYRTQWQVCVRKLCTLCIDYSLPVISVVISLQVRWDQILKILIAALFFCHLFWFQIFVKVYSKSNVTVPGGQTPDCPSSNIHFLCFWLLDLVGTRSRNMKHFLTLVKLALTKAYFLVVDHTTIGIWKEY